MHGAFEILNKENEKTFTYLKKANDGMTAVVCLNFSDEVQDVSVPEIVSNGRDLVFLTGNIGDSVKATKPLEAWEGTVYLLKAPIQKTCEERLRRFPTDDQLEAVFAKSMRV